MVFLMKKIQMMSDEAIIHTNDKIVTVKYKVGLLNLADELGNIGTIVDYLYTDKFSWLHEGV